MMISEILTVKGEGAEGFSPRGVHYPTQAQDFHRESEEDYVLSNVALAARLLDAIPNACGHPNLHVSDEHKNAKYGTAQDWICDDCGATIKVGYHMSEDED